VLSGAVELTLGRGLSIDQSLAFREQWRDGHIELSDSGNPTMLGPQFLNPTPPLVADARFRRALYHAIDRDEMAQTLQGGLVEAAHSGLPFNDRTYDEVKPRVVRYEYDPRRAVQIMQELGYTRGADGLLRDAAGQSLPVQVASSTTDLYIRTALAAASYWKSIGVDSEPFTVPDARERDLEFRANFPAFEAVSSNSGIDSLSNLKSSELRVADNAYRGRNRSRYANAELDALIDRYYTAIPMRERNQVLGDIVHHMTDNVVYMWLFYNGHAMAIANRLVNVNAIQDTANSHDWDVRR
jgi:peptide/nickel transport system substrate-binding protein